MDPMTIAGLVAAGGFANQALGDPFDLSGSKALQGTYKRSAHADRLNQRQNEYQLEAQGIAGDTRGQYNPFIGQLMNQMAATASGQGPTAASALLEASRGQNMANWNAMMASQRGLASPGQAAHQSANMMAQAQQQAASQIAPMAIKERQDAQAMLGQQLNAQQRYELAMRDLSRQYLMQGLGYETGQQGLMQQLAMQGANQQQQLFQNILGGAGFLGGAAIKAQGSGGSGGDGG